MAKPLTSEQAIFMLQEVLMPVLKAEHRVTRAVLEAVPADKPDFRPDPFAKSAIELARHIAATENRFLEATIKGEFNTATGTVPDKVKTPAEIAAWYAEVFENNFEALTKMTGRKTFDNRSAVRTSGGRRRFDPIAWPNRINSAA